MKITRHEVLKILSIIIITAAAMAGVVYITLLLNDDDILQYSILQDSEETKLHGLYVTHISVGEAARVKEGRVNWWRDKDTGKYYIFLPATADLGKLRMGLEGLESVYLDGKEIDNQEFFSVQAGEHKITTEINNRVYEVIFIQSSGTAAVFIDTESESMHHVDSDKRNKESGSILILAENGTVQYSGKLDSIYGRGNVSWEEPKKAYSIKLSKKIDLFGMGAAKKWSLIANYCDMTMLRNYVTYDFAKDSGMAYTPNSVFVDFYTNGDYSGTYQLCETVEVDAERVNISNLQEQTENVNPGMELEKFKIFGSTKGQNDTVPDTFKGYEITNNPKDITGGYLLELDIGDRYLKEESGFVTKRNQAVVLKNPQYASRMQVEYIKEVYQEFEDALYDWEGIHQENGNYYYEYIDINSFAKKYLVEEITKNLDASMTSFFIYKYPDFISNKFFAGPVWDYDRAIGNFGIGYNEENLNDPEGMYASQDVTDSTIWYAIFFRPEFHEAVLDNYYGVFRKNVLKQVEEKIDVQAAKIKESVVMDFIRWSRYDTNDRDEILICYEDEISFMKEFLSKRIAFLDEEWKEIQQ